MAEAREVELLLHREPSRASPMVYLFLLYNRTKNRGMLELKGVEIFFVLCFTAGEP